MSDVAERPSVSTAASVTAEGRIVMMHPVEAGTENQALALPANFAFRRAATGGGTNSETSPPMEAICRTSVAVIGRTAGAAGTNTVWTAGAMVAFMPAI